jgi:hypothetical protein
MYRLLLPLYPSSFRAEYGEEMCRDFARRRQQASGFFGLAVQWMVAIEDSIRNGLAVRRWRAQLDSDGSSGASRSGGCGPSGVTASGVRIVFGRPSQKL